MGQSEMISEESFGERLKIFRQHAKLSGIHIIDSPKARIPDEIQAEAYKYCQDHFGDNWIWSSPIQTDYTDIYFIDPQDALLCRLRFQAYTTA
jgi:hypothetical protein